MVIGMNAILALLLILQPAAAPAPSGSALDAHERRGAVIARLDGAPAQSWRACASACDLNGACQAWTWRTLGRCDLLGSASTPRPHPGAVTGLSQGLSSRIDSSMNRPLSDRELAAIAEAARAPGASDAPAPAPAPSRTYTRSDDLAGGPL